MYDEILFPTDGSDGAAAALDFVSDVAAAHDATLYVLTVTDTTRDGVVHVRGVVVDSLEEEGERIVQEAAESTEERGITTVTEVLQGEPYSTIVDYAESREMDLIVMPTRGRQRLERLLLGSTTERVVRQSDVPVLTLQPEGEASMTYPYRDVLVATDGSDCAGEALSAGIDVAASDHAMLHLLSVIVIPTRRADIWSAIEPDMLEESAEEVVADAATVAAKAGTRKSRRRSSSGRRSTRRSSRTSTSTTSTSWWSGPTDERDSIDTCWEASPSTSSARHRSQC